MTRPPDRDDDLPVFDAVEPTRGDARAARSRSGRGPLGPARGAGAVAGVLVLLIVGIVVGSPPPSPDATGSPFASTGSSPEPSGSGIAGACTPPPRGQFPEVTMGIEGSRQEVTGLFGFGSGYGHQSQAPGWQVPRANHGLVAAEGDRLDVRVAQSVCFRHLIIDYASTAAVPRANVAPLFDSPLTPSTGRVSLDGLPDGDWTVRVTAHFEMLGTVNEDVVTVSYFRVLAGAGPFASDPLPSPAFRAPVVTPAVPCGAGQPTSDLGVTMVAGDGSAVEGSAGSSAAPPNVHTRLGDPILLVTNGEVCATRWRVEMTDQVTGDITTVEEFQDPADDPTYAAQNRWSISGSGVGVVVATLEFPGGLSITRSWRLTIDPFVVPPLFLVGPDGKRFAASPGCGLSLNLSNGYSSGDDCGSVGYVPTDDALRVAAYGVIHLDLTGWSVASWSATCGRIIGTDLPQFESPGGCGLGSGSSDGGGALPDPPAFVLPRGDTIVQMGVIAVDPGGNQFSVAYYARVVAR